MNDEIIKAVMCRYEESEGEDDEVAHLSWSFFPNPLSKSPKVSNQSILIFKTIVISSGLALHHASSVGRRSRAKRKDNQPLRRLRLLPRRTHQYGRHCGYRHWRRGVLIVSDLVGTKVFNGQSKENEGEG